MIKAWIEWYFYRDWNCSDIIIELHPGKWKY